MSDAVAVGPAGCRTGYPRTLGRTPRSDGHEKRRPATRVRIWAVLAAVVAVLAATLSLPAVAGAAEAAPGAENSAARSAVLALTGIHPERAVMPADFGAAQGYLPIEVEGLPVDPGGQCSSPVPLPAEFDTACKAHDLGYDLLRYAELRGHPLGPWARRAVDAALEQHMFDACAARADTIARLRCDTMAAIATGAVDLNSRRQNYAAPMPEYLFGTQLSGTGAGPQLVRVLAPVAVVLLMIATLFVVVRRLIRDRRGTGGRRPNGTHTPFHRAVSHLAASTFASGARHLRRYLTDFRSAVQWTAEVLLPVFGRPEPVIAGAVAAPSRASRATALRISQPGRGTNGHPYAEARGGTVSRPVPEARDLPVRYQNALVRRFRALGRPRTGTFVAITAGFIASLWPGLLPRTSIAQALLTSILILIALGVAGLGRKLLGCFGIDTESRLARYRLPIAAACAIGSIGALGYAWYWQNRLRAAMDFPATGPAYWLHWALGVAAVVVPVLGVMRGLRWAARYVGRLRAVALVAATVLACQFALLPAVVDWQRSAFASADATMDPDVVQPVSFTRSGSPESAANWASLGAEGRKFVSERGLSARVYIGLNSAPDLDSRVALAIRELERSGGFERGNLVMMVPTGSGWLDANAAHGLDQRFGGDATLIGMQYSHAPSWATFLFARADAERSARALFTGIERRLAGLAHPPKLYVYGQSLGATAGSAIFAGDRDETRRVCAALWAGPPAAAVHRGGATVLANSSDPVVQWSPRLLWHAPDLGETRRDAPHPPWLPVLGWVQTTADMLSALAPGPGHGHRYGADQGTALGSC